MDNSNTTSEENIMQLFHELDLMIEKVEGEGLTEDEERLADDLIESIRTGVC